MPSIKSNVFYSILLTVSGYMSTLLVFPYVSRTLGAANTGLVYYVESIVHYFLLFAALGVSSIGTREVAACSKGGEDLKCVFSSIFCIHFVLSLVLSILYCIILHCGLFPNADVKLMMVGAVVIIFSPFTVEWFYKGIEAFRYITMRTLLVRLLFVISVFFLVSDTDDAFVYYVLIAGVILINALINYIHSRKYVRFSFGSVRFSFFKPYATLGVFMIMISMYTTFNTAYLGAVKGTEEVGYYTTSVKIYTLVMALYGAFTSVMLPRMSALISVGKKDLFDSMVEKSFDLLFSLCFPIISFTVYFAADIIRIIAGDGFDGAVVPMQMIMGLILIVGISQIVALQVLLPLRKETLSTLCVSTGAVVGVLSALLLVPRYGAVGSALVLVVSELIGSICYVVCAYKMKLIYFPGYLLFKHALCGVVYFSFIALIDLLIENVYICLGLSSLVLIVMYILLNCFIIKSEIIIEGVTSLIDRLEFIGKKER